MDDEPTIKLKRDTPQATPAPSPPQTEKPLAVKPFRVIPKTSHPSFKRRSKKRRSPLRIALTIFLAFMLLFVGALTTAYFLYYKNIQGSVSQFVRPVSRSNDEPQSNSGSYDTIAGRSWNLLLLGSDNDNKYTFPAVLTQVMMVVHVDTTNNTVSMVSIPRDSWVSVPDIGGMHKIDQAFFLGVNKYGKFEDGVRSARLTIEQDYGITIDRYGWVGLSGFARVIDTLGGVDIDITHPIVDDSYPDDTGKGTDPNNPYAYKRLYIAPGPQHMNGLQALDYVRSRHSDLVGDIGRTQRQQQVLEALKKRLDVSNVITHLPDLIKDMSGQVYTDLSAQEMLAFANFGRTLNGNSISRLTLGPGTGSQNFGSYASVYDPSAGSNQDVILPNCANIQPAISRIFQLNFFAGGCNVTTTG